MSDVVLALRDVSAGYSTGSVLSAVSLEVRAGERWAVLGPNGAGKSTLVRLVMGLLPPSAGELRRGSLGVDPSARDLARVLAWVPQTIDEESGFTALELVLMGLSPHLEAWRVPSVADEVRAVAVMTELDIAALAPRVVAELSGGERRRVWLARALLQAPALLVLDEPTAFLDVKHQLSSLEAVKRRSGSGLAVLAVLHDVNLAARFATHVVLLKAGRVLSSGATPEVLTSARLSELYEVPMREVSPRVFAPDDRPQE